MKTPKLKLTLRLILAAAFAALLGRSWIAPRPVIASGPPVPPGATLGSIVTTGTIPGISSGGVLVAGLTPGNWYLIESSGGPVNVLFGTGPNTCTIAIRDGAGGAWFSRDNWAASTWVSQHDNIGPCPAQTSDWYSYSRFWFVANSASIFVRVYDGAWSDNTGSLDFTVYNVNLPDATPPTTTAGITCPPGASGWCLGRATVTLSAIDPSSPASGIAATYFNMMTYTAPITIATEGVTSFTYYSADNAGNVEPAQSGSVMIDSLAPLTSCTPAGVSGAGGWYVSPVTYSCIRSDTTSGLASTTFDGTSYSGPTTVSTAGTSTHTFYSTDVAGNEEAVQTVSVSIDIDLPTSSLSSHAPGEIVRGAVLLSGDVADSTSGVAQAEVSSDGGAIWDVAVVSGSIWSYPFDTTAVDDGPLMILVRARDLAGNEQIVASAGLTVDNTPPVVSLSAADTDVCVGCMVDNTISLTYAANDAATRISHWSLAIDGGLTLVSGSGDVASTFTWDGSSLPLGPHTARFTATDLAGNAQESTLAVMLHLPPNPPAVSLEVECLLPGDNGWCQMPVRVRILGDSDNSPVTRLEYVRDGQSTSVSDYYLVYEEGANGGHAVSATAIDALGRRSLSASQAFKVDRSMPLAQFAGYDDNVLNITVSDQGSGVVAWMVQVFDGNGQSVFYEDGSGPFSGGLSWVASPDIYQVEMFARDAAGNESHFPRTAFAVLATSPATVLEQVYGFFSPTKTPTVLPATSTAMPASVTPAPATPTATPISPTSTPTVSLRSTSAPSLLPPRVEPPAPAPSPRRVIGLLSLAALLGLLIMWALSAGLDRRAPAIHSLAGELKLLPESRIRGTAGR